MKTEHRGLPFEVAVALGLVPEYPQPWWRRIKNRLMVRFLPWTWWPRIKVEHPADELEAPGEVDFLCFNPVTRELLLNPETTAKAKAAGVEVAQFEKINEVMNQTPEQVSLYWYRHWAEHEDKDYRNGPPPAVFGLTHKKDQDEWTRLQQLQKGFLSYDGACKTGEQGDFEVVRHFEHEDYYIKRKDSDQDRFWTGVVLNIFVPEGHPAALWKTSEREVAEAWLERIKNGTVHSDEEATKANAIDPMSGLPKATQPDSSQAQADQGQEGP